MKPTKGRSQLTCGVREAKARLSQLLEEVRQGAEVLITDRGKPVGKLVGLATGDLSLDMRLGRMVQLRLLEAKDARSRSPLPPPLPRLGSVAQQYLQEDRDR